MRTCSSPYPALGGKVCPGTHTETQACNSGYCPVHGGWAGWSAWSSCSKTCEGGEQSRTRTCSAPYPALGGEICSGAHISTQACGSSNCRVDGKWTAWSSWSPCSKTCGGGQESRTRTCSDPFPKFGGKVCPGAHLKTQSCGSENCQVDGNWANWSAWSSCSETCGEGQKSRTRTCSAPHPELGGDICPGAHIDTQACGSGNCRLDGNWADWSAWTSCSLTCGRGEQSRSRTCSAPHPAHGGLVCPGDSTEAQSCITASCPSVTILRRGQYGYPKVNLPEGLTKQLTVLRAKIFGVVTKQVRETQLAS